MTAEAPPPPPQNPKAGFDLKAARDAVADAVRFFTRAPVPAGWTRGDDGLNGAAAASPIAGAVVGLSSGSVLVIALAAGLPPLPSAVAAAMAATAITGAFHLDGLSDMADGLGGATRDRRLEIMRDSRLGAFGGAALALSLIMRVCLIAALVERLGAGDAVLALVSAAALSRPLAFLPAALLAPAREDGLGAAARPVRASLAFGLAGGVAIALLSSGLAMGVAAIGLAGAAAALVIALARRAFGGFTGDVCGASAEAAELAALVGLLAAAV